MKKNYSKPQIMFDSFELSQSIAGACAGVQSDQAPYDCPVDFGGPLTLFAAMCDITPAPGDNKVCYDVPSDDSRLFGS